MKTESYTCDVCDFKSATGAPMFDAYLNIGCSKSRPMVSHQFHVCTTCYQESPKGVFQKAFNALIRKKNK